MSDTPAPDQEQQNNQPTPLWKKALPWVITLACFAFLYTRISGPAAAQGMSVLGYLGNVFANVDWIAWLSLMIPYSIAFLLGWIVLFYGWVFGLGLPVGPDAPTYYP